MSWKIGSKVFEFFFAKSFFTKTKDSFQNKKNQHCYTVNGCCDALKTKFYMSFPRKVLIHFLILIQSVYKNVLYLGRCLYKGNDSTQFQVEFSTTFSVVKIAAPNLYFFIFSLLLLFRREDCFLSCFNSSREDIPRDFRATKM